MIKYRCKFEVYVAIYFFKDGSNYNLFWETMMFCGRIKGIEKYDRLE